MRRYALRDDQWNRIEPLLPGKAGDVGVTARDNRLFVEAVPTGIARALPGAISRSCSGISGSFTRLTCAGAAKAFGSAFSRRWPKTPTMNTR